MWARDVFRNTILTGLARLRDACQVQTSVREFASPPAFSLRQEVTALSESTSHPMEALEDVDVATNTPRLDSPSSASPASSASGGRFTPPSESSPPHKTTKRTIDMRGGVENGTYGTVRHACLIKFEFVHVTLPDEMALCMKLLRRIHGIARRPTLADLEGKARALLGLFNSNDVAVFLNQGQISLLRHDWLGAADNDLSFSHEWTSPSLTVISLTSEFDRNTWHVVRRLTCISCPVSAAESLSRIAWQAHGVPLNNMSADTTSFNQTVAALAAVRDLPSELSVQTALQSRSLYMGTDKRTTVREWLPLYQKISNTLNPIVSFMRNEHIVTSRALYTRGSALREVAPKSLTVKLSTLLGSNINESDGAVLLKKPDHWPDSTENWCLLTLKSEGSNRMAVTGDMLALAIDKGQVYNVPKGRNIPRLCRYVLDEATEECLRNWGENLTHKTVL